MFLFCLVTTFKYFTFTSKYVIIIWLIFIFKNLSKIGKYEMNISDMCLLIFQGGYFNLFLKLMFQFLQLFDHCLAPNTHGDGTGCDNMTCIIVVFSWMKNSTVNEKSAGLSNFQHTFIPFFLDFILYFF